jgi:uncharacterized protein
MVDDSLVFGIAERHYADLAEIFARYPNIVRVFIFGSRAKGTAKASSDIDLAVVAPEMSDQEFSRLWNELDALPLVFKLDVLHWDRLGEQKLKENITRDGQLFYPLDIPLPAEPQPRSSNQA